MAMAQADTLLNLEKTLEKLLGILKKDGGTWQKHLTKIGVWGHLATERPFNIFIKVI